MFNVKFKSRASRAKQMRENLSIIVAAQRSKSSIIVPFPSLPGIAVRPWSKEGDTSRAHEIGEKLSFTVAAQRSRSAMNMTLPFPIPTTPRPWTNQQDENLQNRPPTRAGFQNVTITDFPHFVPQSRPRTANGWLSKSCSSQTVIRTPNRQRQVYNNNTDVLLQSPWIQRKETEATTTLDQVNFTKQYSIKELIDILCGDSPGKPTPEVSP